MSEEEPDYPKIADELMSGTVIPFFGAAASAVYRPPDAEWEQGAPFLPFGSELAKILAQNSSYSAANAAYEAALFELADAAAKAAPGVPVDEIKTALQPVLREHFGMPTDLALIASFFSQVYRSRPILEQVLGKVFAAAPEPGALQTRLAAIESIKLYVTTNYDDLLERALAPRVPHVLVDRLEKGLAICTSSGTLEPIARTGQDLDTRLTDPNTGEPSRPILFKMHGSISRNSAQNASYVITEEDYVDYLGRDGGNYVPPTSTAECRAGVSCSLAIVWKTGTFV
jgi:hypothetical protein